MISNGNRVFCLSAAKLCPTLSNPMDCSTPGFPVLRCLLELAQLFQSCLPLCDSVDCSPLGSSVHGILQARILEWAAISFSKGIFPTQESNPGLISGAYF